MTTVERATATFPLRGWPAKRSTNITSAPRVPLRVVAYCAEEVRRQRDTPWHVYRMVLTWMNALDWWARDRRLTVERILAIGKTIDEANERGFRLGPVMVGGEQKAPPGCVPQLMEQLVDAQHRLTPEEFYLEFETIHPFYDGNGRTGKVLYNWLRGSLHDPVWPPDFFSKPGQPPIENP